ncbi:MAG: response regulator transcription factor [Gemmatimonadetes bacterium]|nr:response regulator transcription factor [Gemmatimonadota bacterium]
MGPTDNPDVSRKAPTRVLVVDDEPLFRELVTVTLSAAGSIQVVGAAERGQEAVDMAERTAPDVVVMDIELGSEPDGIRAAHQIKAANPAVGIVIVSVHRERQYLAALPSRRAAGWSFLLKRSIRDPQTLVRAIEGAARGLVTMDPAVLEDLRPRRRSALERLSGEQLAVLAMIAAGYADAAIARELCVDEASVRRAVESVYRDLGIEGDGAEADPRVRAALLYMQETSEKPRSGGAHRPR